MLLAIDTATRTAGLALYDQERGRILGEEVWYSSNNHTIELMPRLVRLMDQHGVSPSHLSGLVVSLGPGSFTGLRIGLGVGKGIALAHNVPIAGVPTLDVVAQPHKTQRLPIWAIIQSGRGRICVGYYVRHRGRWRRRGDYRITTLEALCDEVEEAAFFCGEMDTQAGELLRQRLGLMATVSTPAASLRRAAHLAELGWERFKREDSDDVATLSPIYLHHPQIDA
jgi:tRNA threonylcarbamoyladenosine biosynthesis protein TsaB